MMTNANESLRLAVVRSELDYVESHINVLEAHLRRLQALPSAPLTKAGIEAVGTYLDQLRANHITLRRELGLPVSVEETAFYAGMMERYAVEN